MWLGPMLCQRLSTVHGHFWGAFVSPPSGATTGLHCCWQGHVFWHGLQPGQWGGDGVGECHRSQGTHATPQGFTRPGNFWAAPRRHDGRERRAAKTAPALPEHQCGWEALRAERDFRRGPFAGASGCRKRLCAAGPVLKIPVRDFIPPAGLHLCGTRPLSSGQRRCCRLGH